MSYDLNLPVAPEAADLAAALVRALREQPSRQWKLPFHSLKPVQVVLAPGLAIVPVISLTDLEKAVSKLLACQGDSTGGAGLILLPEDVPLANLEDLVEPLLDYGVSVESAGDVMQEAQNQKARAERHREETRARWDAQKTDHGARSHR
jgi:hypothetical protein